MDWFKVTLSVSDVAAGRAITLQNRFIELFAAAGAPKDAGMFESNDVMLNDYYFSPGAVAFALALIEAHSGETCGAPARSEVRILAANTGAEDIPFSIC